MSAGCAKIKDVCVVIHLFEVGFKEMAYLFIFSKWFLYRYKKKSCDLGENVVLANNSFKGMSLVDALRGALPATDSPMGLAFLL